MFWKVRETPARGRRSPHVVARAEDAAKSDPVLPGSQPLEHLFPHDRRSGSRRRGLLGVGDNGHGAGAGPPRGDCRLQFVPHRLGLPTITADCQHLTAVGAHHPPLARHLVERKIGAKIATQPRSRAR